MVIPFPRNKRTTTQDTRTDDGPRPRRGLACRTVLFHPDCDRRLWSLTRSADPSRLTRRALAGFGFDPVTAGGDFHPALRTRPPDVDGVLKIDLSAIQTSV